MLPSLSTFLNRSTLVRQATYIIFFVRLAAVTSVPLTIAIWQLQKYRNSPTGVNCTNDRGGGNNDMYGLGVRIATYIQCSLMGLALAFKAPGETRRDISIGNTWFLIAFTTAVWAMLRNPNIEILDLYVVIVLGNGLTVLMFAHSLVVPGINTFLTLYTKFTIKILQCIVKFDTFIMESITGFQEPDFSNEIINNTITIFMLVLESMNEPTFTPFETQLTLFCQILVLALWRACTTVFWWKTLPSSAVPQPGCEKYGYLFVRASLAPGAPLHTFHKMLNILGLVFCFWQFVMLAIGVTEVVTFVMSRQSFPRLLERLPHRSRLRVLVDLLIVFPCLQVRSVMQRNSSYITAG